MIAVLRAPARVLFGRGSIAAIGQLVQPFGSRFLICTDPAIAATYALEAVRSALDSVQAAHSVFDGVEPDVPLHVIAAAADAAYAFRADAVIAVGGGSSIDVAKITALRLRHDAPIDRFYGENKVPGPVAPVVAVPTTAGSGSEVTPVAIVTDADRRLKIGISSPHLVPSVAICDPDLTRSCPAAESAYAGIDALAHAIEAFTARSPVGGWETAFERVAIGKNPFSDALALEAIRRIGASLERVVVDGSDAGARESMLMGSTLAGLAFAQAGVAAAHALQYPVGATTATPHGLGVGLLLPYVMQFNARVCRQELAQAAVALGATPGEDPATLAAAAVERVLALGRSIGLPPTLGDLGVSFETLPELARTALGIQRLIDNNPRPLDHASLEKILEAAWSGDHRLLD